MSFNWYRITITIPERVGTVDPTGTTVVFVTTIDDYSEIWVNGELPRWVGQTGGGVISGFNVPNRLVIGRNVKPGQKIQVSVFGINGPLSAAPANTIFMRKGSRVEFYGGPIGPVALNPGEYGADVDKLDKAAIVPIISPEPKLYKLADGFKFNGGAIWSGEGYLLFGDMEANTIYKYTPKDAELSVFRNPSDNSGPGLGESSQPSITLLSYDGLTSMKANETGTVRAIRAYPKAGVVQVVRSRISWDSGHEHNKVILGACRR